MAKKTDKALKELAKEVKKLRKDNEKLGKNLEESHREILSLLDERLAVREEIPTDHTGDGRPGELISEDSENRTEETEEDQAPEVTEAAERRAKELGVDPATVKGTGSGGRVLVKDVEAAAG